MGKQIKIFTAILLLICSINIFGQKEEAEIKILSRVQKDKILLRWAASTASAWKKTNTTGFLLEKYVLFRDGKRLPNLEKVWQKHIKSAPLNTWQKIVEQDNNAAIIAQALYGESFFVNGGNNTQLADIYNLVNEIEQRFSFSLLAAEMNFEAAKKAGWGYIDTEVKENETYVYRIKAAISSKKNEIKGNSVIASIKKYETLPVPIDFQGIFGDKKVTLTWEYQLLKKIYTSYSLERSEDGKNFKPLSNEPLVNLNNKPNAPAKRMFYIDTLANNNKTYYYRVHGITSFGEKGNYSKIVLGKGQPILAYTPRITDTKFTSKLDEAIISWEFPKEGEKVIQKFKIIASPKDNGNYVTVADNVLPTKRTYTLSKLNASNYVKVVAIGKDLKQQKSSFSVLVQLQDIIPPVVPIDLEGKIDSLGIVRFSWKKNEEKDLLGYRIFRGFTKEEEPSQITVSPIGQNKYLDTVGVKNLNAKVYYQVVAVDKRFNHSQKSKVLVLEKPDFIPPTAPVFSNYNIEEGKIKLYWIRSSEEEVTHVLSRKNITDNLAWKTVLTTKDTITKFIDTSPKSNTVYRYAIKAIDKANLSSLPSSPLTIKSASESISTGIKGLNYIVNRETNQIEIFWRFSKYKVAEYTIYKQLKEKSPSIWKVLPGVIKKVVDKEVSPNETYIYHIRASLVNGAYSKIKTIEIKY